MGPKDLETVLHILLGEHEIHCSEVRQMADKHIRITFIMTLSEIALYGTSYFRGQMQTDLGGWLFCGIMVLVLAQIALIFNNHYFVIALLSEYISLLEEKIRRITRAPILEYETKYVPLYFNSPTFGKAGNAGNDRSRSPLALVASLYREPHFVFEAMLFAPSLLLALVCYCQVLKSGSRPQIASALLIAEVYVLFACAFLEKKRRLREQFRQMREEILDGFVRYVALRTVKTPPEGLVKASPAETGEG